MQFIFEVTKSESVKCNNFFTDYDFNETGVNEDEYEFVLAISKEDDVSERVPISEPCTEEELNELKKRVANEIKEFVKNNNDNDGVCTISVYKLLGGIRNV